MKWQGRGLLLLPIECHPLRRVWIEILSVASIGKVYRCHPLRRVWIEIDHLIYLIVWTNVSPSAEGVD